MKLCLKLHRLFRLIQRQNRFVASAPSSGLSLFESHVLLEVGARQPLSCGALLAVLHCDQGRLSHTIAKLQRAELLRVAADASDRRRRELTLTDGGRRTLRTIDQTADGQVERSLAPLSGSERALIGELYARIGDGWRAPAAQSRSGEHALRAAQRRITRCFGLLGDSAFESGMASSAFQVLAFLAEHGGASAVKTIAAALALRKSNLSAILAAQRAAGLVEQLTDAGDRRHQRVSLTARGSAKLAAIECRAAAALEQALHGSRVAELSKMVAALERYAMNGATTGAYRDLKISRSVGEQAEARAFMLRNLVRLGLEGYAPALLCGSGSETYQAHHETQLVAAVHLVGRGSIWRVDCMAWAGELDRSELLDIIYSSVLREQERLGRRTTSRLGALMRGAGMQVYVQTNSVHISISH